MFAFVGVGERTGWVVGIGTLIDIDIFLHCNVNCQDASVNIERID